MSDPTTAKWTEGDEMGEMSADGGVTTDFGGRMDDADDKAPEDPWVDGRALVIPGQNVPEQRALEVAFTPAQKELIKAINPTATVAELQMFMYQAARTGLDPIAKQIYLVKRDGKMAVQTGIDGFRLVGHRTGMIAGVDDPVFEEKDGKLVKASVTIYRIAADGNRYPYTATAYWSEYAPADMDAPAAFMWRKMPHTMLGKCAEALAWRKVCPAELSGVYTDDEMAQTDFSALGQPKQENLTEYRCPHCGSAVIDNRDAPPGRSGNKQSAWKCSNRDCGGGGKKKDGGNWPWGTFDVGFFEPGGDGGDYGAPPEIIEATHYDPATPDPEVLAKAWDRDDPERPFTSSDVTPGLFDAVAEGRISEAEVLETTLWGDLLQWLNLPIRGSQPQLKHLCVGLCRLMEQNSLWPAGSLDALLRRWPQVEEWEQLPSREAKVKFTASVFDHAKQRVAEALKEEAPRG